MAKSKFQENAKFKKGLTVRRKVLGRKHVDASLAAAAEDPFVKDLQQWVTEGCWGEVWTRPGLNRKTRSIINLAMLAALNRPHELQLHVRGAINNGLTKNEIKELFLQVGVYCGAPAAIDAFRQARAVFEEME